MSRASSPSIDALSAQLGAALKVRGWKLVTAESCTGGWVAQAVTAIPGSSEWFDRGYVTYSNRAKCEELGLSEITLQQSGAVSEAAAREMAQGALARSGCDMAVSVSGIAGPSGGTTQKPVGTVCLAWATRAGSVQSATHWFDGDRAHVREQSVAAALLGLLRLTE